MSSRGSPGVLSLTGLLLAACVGYRPAPVSVPAAAAGFAPLPAGPLSFDAAVRALVERNPELQRLQAEASAVNTRPGPAPLVGSTQVMDGNVTETMIGTDILSLLGIGPRGAERALARAMRSEALLRHHERARDLVADLAESYAVVRVLGTLDDPRPALDVEAFERAGLASGSALAAARAALAQADAERAVIRTSREDARREIARLLGAAPESLHDPVLVPSAWPPVPAPDARALLYARGDLVRARGAYEVADRRLRLAVTRQWPNLGVFLGGNVNAETPMQMIQISLPLDAPAEARAMTCAREAARAGFQSAVLDALHDAASKRLLLEAAEARLAGARAQREAAAALGRAASARVETSAEDAFSDAVLAALEEVRAAVAWREAAVEVARARVRAARAAGWPGAEEVGGVPCVN